MNPDVLRLYREFRKASPFMLVGREAECALHAARTLHRFRDLSRAGAVRFRTEFDEFPDTSFMSDKQLDAWAAAGAESWVSVGEYLCPSCGTWSIADCVGGHMGYRDASDPFENPYVIDVMSETLKAWEDALNA